MLTVVGLYLVLNFAYVRTLGAGGVAESKLVAAALARASLGAAGEAVVSALIFLSAAGFVNATVLQMPRSYYAMAEDGVLPRGLPARRPRTQVSMAGLLLFGATMLVPAFLLGSFEKLLNYVIFTDMLTLVVVSSTLFVLRRRGEGGNGEAARSGSRASPSFPRSTSSRSSPSRRTWRSPSRASRWRGRRSSSRGGRCSCSGEG